MKKPARIILFYVLPIILVLLLLASLILPFGIKRYLNRHGIEYTGRKTTVQKIQINYFTTTLSVLDFKLYEADGNTMFVSFDTLLVDISPLPLLSSKLVVDKFRLVNPAVSIIRKNSVFNFDDILAFMDKESRKDSTEVPSKPFGYFLNNISLEKGTLVFDDQTVSYTTHLKDLGFFIPSLSFNQDEIKDAGIKFNFVNGGSFEAKTDYNQKSGDYKADFSVDRLNLAPFLSYAKDYFRINGLSGLLAGDFHLSGNINKPDSLLFSGEAHATDFAANDLAGKKVLGAKSAGIRLRDSYPLLYDYKFGLIQLTEPYLYVEMKDSTINLLHLMVESPADNDSLGYTASPADKYAYGDAPSPLDTASPGGAHAPVKKHLTGGNASSGHSAAADHNPSSAIGSSSVNRTSPGYAYQIDKFRIEDGIIDLRDNTYEAPFDYNLSEIGMKVDSISSAAKWLNAYATMKLNKRGKLQAEVGINPSDPYELNLNYVISNFQLSDLNIYSLHYVGFPVLLGNMYYKGNTVIAGKQLKSENKLIIRDAKLGKKSGGLIDIPLKLALYLLKDINGDIILDLPLTGDLNDPKTKIGRLVWQMLKNVVVKVVASPFIALSGLLGVEPAEVKGIEFNYADTTFTATHMRRIKLFTELEQKKPDMKIELTSYNDTSLEKREIALQEAGKQFFIATGTDAKKDNTGFVTFLAGKIQRDTLSAVTGSRLFIGEHKLDSLQQSIEQYRIRRIEDALKSFSDSTRITVVVPNREVPENVGSRPVFELKFSIEE